MARDLQTWINSGLMALFFLVVGLEARREIDLGELRDRRRLVLPLAAGLSGMALPVAIYLATTAAGPGTHGWGVAMSTDTALAMGLLAVVGRGAPGQVRAFLLTVFVVDDLVALAVIVVAYPDRRAGAVARIERGELDGAPAEAMAPVRPLRHAARGLPAGASTRSSRRAAWSSKSGLGWRCPVARARCRSIWPRRAGMPISAVTNSLTRLGRAPGYRAGWRRDSTERRRVHWAFAEATDPATDPDCRAWHRAHPANWLEEELALLAAGYPRASPRPARAIPPPSRPPALGGYAEATGELRRRHPCSCSTGARGFPRASAMIRSATGSSTRPGTSEPSSARVGPA